MEPLRVIIAEDELLARRRLRRLLEEAQGAELVAECSDGAELLATLRRVEADLVLLDIRMPRLDGLQAAELIGDDGPQVVFVSAHAEHALQAFAVEATDYLLKPVDADGLGRALQRARRRKERSAAGASPPPRGVGRSDDGGGVPSLPERLPVSTRRGIVLIDPRQLLYAEIDGQSCLLHTQTERYVTDFRLSELARRLPAETFVRVHRRVLLNPAAVERLEPVETGGYEAHLRGGGCVPVSRQAARELRRGWQLPR